MILVSGDGTSVELTPVRYQFDDLPNTHTHDLNWLVIQGDFTLTDGRSWSFTDPCLTTS